LAIQGRQDLRALLVPKEIQDQDLLVRRAILVPRGPKGLEILGQQGLKALATLAQLDPKALPDLKATRERD